MSKKIVEPENKCKYINNYIKEFVRLYENIDTDKMDDEDVGHLEKMNRLFREAMEFLRDACSDIREWGHYRISELQEEVYFLEGCVSGYRADMEDLKSEIDSLKSEINLGGFE